MLEAYFQVSIFPLVAVSKYWGEALRWFSEIAASEPILHQLVAVMEDEKPQHNLCECGHMIRMGLNKYYQHIGILSVIGTVQPSGPGVVPVNNQCLLKSNWNASWVTQLRCQTVGGSLHITQVAACQVNGRIGWPCWNPINSWPKQWKRRPFDCPSRRWQETRSERFQFHARVAVHLPR